MDDMTDPKAVNDKIPSSLHMMNHIVRSTAYSTHTKCFLNTNTVLSLTQNNAATCLENVKCTKHVVDTSRAHTQHYRQTCPDTLKKVCNRMFKQNVVKDTRVWKHLETVLTNTKNALEKIDFYF